MGESDAEDMLDENGITDLVLDCMRHLSPRGQRRFVAGVLGVGGLNTEVAGLEVFGRTRKLDGRAHGAGPRDPEPRAVLVTIAGDARLDGVDSKTAMGSEVDGVLLWRGDLVVLLECKLAGNRPARNQLIRHADRWGIPHELELWTDVSEPPRGFGFVTWSGLLDRASDLVGGTALDDADRRRVDRLIRALRDVGGRLDAAGPRVSGRGRPIAVTGIPTPVALEEILVRAGVCARVVWAACERTYRRGGAGEVANKHACVRDARRLEADYAAADLPLPPSLSETNDGIPYNVMTPDRLLTCAVQGKFLNTLADDERMMLRRLLGRGADRLTLIALWAWTQTPDAPGTDAQKDACLTALRHLWSGAYPLPIANPDLAAELADVVDTASLPER